MSKLPQTDELPHADEGFDPARVEEAFATFADRVRELESVASELRAELHSLRAERSAPSHFADEDWPVNAAQRRRPAGGRLGRQGAAAARPRLHRAPARARRRVPAAGRAPRRHRRPQRRVDRARDGRRLGARRPRGVDRGRQALSLAPRRDRPAGGRAGTGRRRQHRAVGHAGRRVDGDRRAAGGLGVEDDRDEAARRPPSRRAGAAPEPAPAGKRRLGLRRRKQPAEAGSADPWDA